MYNVYVLQSLKNKRLYTGSTNNLERRLIEHNGGYKGYAKYAGPFKLIYKETYATRVEAYRREMFLKTGKGREEIREILDKRG